MKYPSLLSFLLKAVFVCCSTLPIIASCGTQVGNPTDNDGPTKNSTDKPKESGKPKESAKPAADRADSKSIENAPSTTQGLPNNSCSITVTSETLTPPATIGSLTIALAKGGECTASMTPPGLTAVNGKTLPFTTTGTYKFTVVPTQGTSCSAEITIDQDLLQKNVSISVTLP